MMISMSELTPHFGELDTIFGDFKTVWEETSQKVEVHLGVARCDSTTKTAFAVNTSRTWAIQGFTLPCWCPSQCLQPFKIAKDSCQASFVRLDGMLCFYFHFLLRTFMPAWRVLVRSGLHYKVLSCAVCMAGYARSGSLLPASAPRRPSTCSSGGASTAEVDEAIRQAQPRAVPATAFCTATDKMLHHLRAQPQLAVRRTARGAPNAWTRTRSRTKPSAPPFHRPPTSAPSTMRHCGPAAASSGYVARLLRCSGRVGCLSGCRPSRRIWGPHPAAKPWGTISGAWAPHTTRWA